MDHTYATKDEIKEILRDALKDFATKDDLHAFITKEDLQTFVTKDDLNAIKVELKKFATKDDLHINTERILARIDYNQEVNIQHHLETKKMVGELTKAHTKFRENIGRASKS